jgi:hypothetical protein
MEIPSQKTQAPPGGNALPSGLRGLVYKIVFAYTRANQTVTNASFDSGKSFAAVG